MAYFIYIKDFLKVPLIKENIRSPIGFVNPACHFCSFTNHVNMKTQQTTISEVRLVYRTKVKASERLQVKCSKEAFDIFMETWDLDSTEHYKEFKVMRLTMTNRVLGIASISKGGISSNVTDVRIIKVYCIILMNKDRFSWYLSNSYKIKLYHNLV